MSECQKNKEQKQVQRHIERVEINVGINKGI